ncbi:MAG: hypothetical protein IJF07_06300 [Lachnospiraceae bacterium]|nr:hypothetical protein [Lachnospiraceae bacterium]
MDVDDKILQLEKQIVKLVRQLGDAREEINQKSESLEELIKANLDFDNLLMNAEIGALYIDTDLKIRKLTPIMAKHTNLKLSDTG